MEVIFAGRFTQDFRYKRLWSTRKMSAYNRFHCHLTIVRKTLLEKEEIFYKSFYHVFFSEVPTRAISIGSSEDSDIKIEGLLALHCSFHFQNDSLVWSSYGESRFIFEDTNIILKDKDSQNVPFSSNALEEEGILTHWQVKILPFVYLEGMVWIEKEFLSENSLVCLQDMYGKIQKIQEGKTCQIFSTQDNKILKILCNSEILKKEKFSKISQAWQKISSKRLISIEKIVDVPFHICMENSPGESLENYYARNGILNYRDSLTILRGLLKALREMEGLEVPYPVFLPEGILYFQGKIKIQSFHLSLPEKNFTEDLVPYLAPEYWQSKENPEINWVKGNIFSIGIIFYRLLTGKLLFGNRKTYLESMETKIFLDRYTLLRGSPRITPQLSELLEGMLSFHPQDRFSPEEALQAFSEISDVGVWASSLRLSENAQKENCRFGLEMVVSCGEEVKKVFPIEDNSSIIIGRTGDIEVPGDSKVSKQHATVILKEGQAILKDMGSRNGTTVNGEKIQECILPNGGTFVLGLTTFRFWDYGAVKETQKILIQKRQVKEDKPALKDMLEDEDEEPGINTENYSIQSKKLRQIYETMEMPEIKKRHNPLKNIPGLKGDRISLYIRVISGIAGILLFSFIIVFLYLAVQPAASQKVATIEKEEPILARSVISNSSSLPEIQQQEAPKFAFTLEGKYLAEDKIKIQGKYQGQNLKLIVKTSKGDTLYNQKIPLHDNAYEADILLPGNIQYVQVSAILEGKRKKTVFRFEYPAQYKINENLANIKEIASFFFKKLLQEMQNFLVSQNIDSLEKALDIWEEAFDKKAKQTILINQQNFGIHKASLESLLKEIKNLESFLRDFLVFRRQFSPQATTLEKVFSSSGAFSIYQKIEKHSLEIWNDKEIFSFPLKKNQ